MTSRNEVRIDIEVEGGTKCRASVQPRGQGRPWPWAVYPRPYQSSHRCGARVRHFGRWAAFGLALSSGAASNSLIRIQGSLEGLVGTITRKLEPAIDFAASRFEKLPIGAQLGVLATGAILGVVVLVKLIGASGWRQLLVL